MSRQIISRFPDFDKQFFPILEELNITLTDEEYIAFLNCTQQAKDIVDVASLLQKAGILTGPRYNTILGHKEIHQIKTIFSYLQGIHSLTKDNFDLIMNCKDSLERRYIHTLFILKNENPTLITDKIFKAILEHGNMRLIVDICSRNSPILNAICTLLTEKLLTKSVLEKLKECSNPEEFAQDLKTAKLVAARYRDDKIKSGFFSRSSKSSIDIVSALENFSNTGNYRLFRSTTAEKKPGKRLQTILNAEGQEGVVSRMISAH